MIKRGGVVGDGTNEWTKARWSCCVWCLFVLFVRKKGFDKTNETNNSLDLFEVLWMRWKSQQLLSLLMLLVLMLCRCWCCVGVVLVLCWCCVGVVLMLCWCWMNVHQTEETKFIIQFWTPTANKKTRSSRSCRLTEWMAKTIESWLNFPKNWPNSCP